MPGEYDRAQICINGHVANSRSINSPQCNQKFCETCGTATIAYCPKCNAPIRGYYYGGKSNVVPYVAPGFCIACGESFPWTKSKIEATDALAKELDVNEEDRAVLAKSIDELVKDTPSSQVAAIRFKKIMIKIGETSGLMFREILINVISEAAKKTIWP